MRREYIISVVVLLVIGGVVFGVYQFYLKERLEKYAADQLKLEQLHAKYEELDRKFEGHRPEDVIQDIKNRVRPWEEAVETRAGYFNMASFREFDPVPNDEFSYKLYYMNRAPKQYNTFMEYLIQEGKANAIPANLNLWFGAPNPNAASMSADPNRLQVAMWLGAMQFGHSFVRLFVDADVVALHDLRLWQERTANQVLRAYTAGAEFDITMENLVTFLNDMRFDRERYCDVNAIRIANPLLKGNWAIDPWLQVQMLLTLAEYDSTKRVRVIPAATSQQQQGAELFVGSDDDDDDDARRQQKLSIMDRILRLFPF
jgi:hypothetical protein